MKEQVILLLGLCAVVAWGDKPPQPGYHAPPHPPHHDPHPAHHDPHPPHHAPQPAYHPPQPAYGHPQPHYVESGGKGKGGKGGGKGGDDYSHIDFGPPQWVYQPVTHYREREVQRPVTVYQPHIVKEPVIKYKKVLQPPPPKLIKKPVQTYVQEWKLVPVPKITYQDVWVHPYFEEEKKAEKGCWFCGKGKGSKDEEEVVIIDEGYHPPHQPSYGHHQPKPTYGAPPHGHH